MLSVSLTFFHCIIGPGGKLCCVELPNLLWSFMVSFQVLVSLSQPLPHSLVLLHCCKKHLCAHRLQILPLKRRDEWPALHIFLEARVGFLGCLEQTHLPRALLAGSFYSSCLPLGLPKQLRAKLSIPALLTVLFIIEFLLANILITVWSSLWGCFFSHSHGNPGMHQDVQPWVLYPLLVSSAPWSLIFWGSMPLETVLMVARVHCGGCLCLKVVTGKSLGDWGDGFSHENLEFSESSAARKASLVFLFSVALSSKCVHLLAPAHMPVCTHACDRHQCPGCFRHCVTGTTWLLIRIMYYCINIYLSGISLFWTSILFPFFFLPKLRTFLFALFGDMYIITPHLCPESSLFPVCFLIHIIKAI